MEATQRIAVSRFDPFFQLVLLADARYGRIPGNSLPLGHCIQTEPGGPEWNEAGTSLRVLPKTSGANLLVAITRDAIQWPFSQQRNKEVLEQGKRSWGAFSDGAMRRPLHNAVRFFSLFGVNREMQTPGSFLQAHRETKPKEYPVGTFPDCIASRSIQGRRAGAAIRRKSALVFGLLLLSGATRPGDSAART